MVNNEVKATNKKGLKGSERQHDPLMAVMNGYSQKGILHTGAFLKSCLKGLIVTGSKNVKILKYRNETKILQDCNLPDESKMRLRKNVNLVFHMEKFRNNCTFNVHLKSKR